MRVWTQHACDVIMPWRLQMPHWRTCSWQLRCHQSQCEHHVSTHTQRNVRTYIQSSYTSWRHRIDIVTSNHTTIRKCIAHTSRDSNAHGNWWRQRWAHTHMWRHRPHGTVSHNSTSVHYLRSSITKKKKSCAWRTTIDTRKKLTSRMVTFRQ